MLYGHIEQPLHRIDHLIRFASCRTRPAAFKRSSRWPSTRKTPGLSHLKKPSSLMDLRTMAVSRLMLDNMPHIKAYWIMLGIGTAQVALSYGADDLDGTVRHELIYHDAGATTPEALSVDEIRRLIVAAGREPVERDTLYRLVVRDPDAPSCWTVSDRESGAGPEPAVRRILSHPRSKEYGSKR